jgi:hypothetical protein
MRGRIQTHWGLKLIIHLSTKRVDSRRQEIEKHVRFWQQPVEISALTRS